jgi:tryptophan synthase alpha chain
MQSTVASTISEMTKRIRAHTDLPIAVGFGISTPEQAKAVAGHADAVVVGSAIVNEIARLGNSPDLVPEVSRAVKALGRAIKESSRAPVKRDV